MESSVRCSGGSVLGVIGGSGVYDIDGLSNTRWQRVTSPFGDPSDELLFGELAGQQLVFLPRHGRGHRIAPTDINYRANIDVLKRAGVTDVISMSAVGSLREHLAPVGWEPGPLGQSDRRSDSEGAR